jgi:hypothetical protein
MRLTMRTNLKVILSAAGVAALLASPASAKTVRHHGAVPSTVYLPGNAQGSAGPYGYGVREGGPYTPSAPFSPRYNRDFQDSPGRSG